MALSPVKVARNRRRTGRRPHVRIGRTRAQAHLCKPFAILLILLIACVSGPSPGAGAPTAADVRQAIESVYEADNYQKSFPTPEPTTRLQKIEPIELPDMSGIPDAARVLLWIIAGGAVVLGLMWVVNEMPRWTRSVHDPSEMAGPEDAGYDGDPLPDDTEHLARQGRYAEAVHVLLLNALDRMLERSDEQFSPSLTSREILSRPDIAGSARTALGVLVDSVERTLFGGRPATEADYRRCRASFDEFAAEAAGRPA